VQAIMTAGEVVAADAASGPGSAPVTLVAAVQGEGFYVPLNQRPAGHLMMAASTGPSVERMLIRRLTWAGSPHRAAPSWPRQAGQSRNIIVAPAITGWGAWLGCGSVAVLARPKTGLVCDQGGALAGPGRYGILAVAMVKNAGRAAWPGVSRATVATESPIRRVGVRLIGAFRWLAGDV
jgi:hypothetical protein